MKTLTRRDFLKLCSLSLGTLAFLPPAAGRPLWPEEERLPVVVGKARVATNAIYIYREPNFKSDKVGTFKRDKIVRIIDELESPHGPLSNPRWYRLLDGFVHSGYLQRVEKASLNPVHDIIPEGGQLGEVTLPYTQSLCRTRNAGWMPLYRLYYQAVFWVTSLEEGPDGRPWYGLTDDRLRVQYYVPAAHIRLIPPQELEPISPHVPVQEKRIEISIQDQTLTAYEGDQVVLSTKVSTGLPSNGPSPNGIPTETPEGNFRIQVKVPSRHMGNGDLTSDIEAYELPGVPWVSFFHITGVGLHGTYWHDNFGRRMSHGCVNMRNADARWIYRWSAPEAAPEDWNRKGNGTLIKVF